MVSGGIDLSLPATAVLGVALLSLGLAEWHTPYLLLLALLAAVCLLCGAINGLLALAAGLPPLLATLSTSVAFTGLTDLLTGQRRIAVSDPLMVAFRDNSVLGLPWPLVYLLGVFILFQFLLHHSRFGQHVQAVGGNRDMAQMSGLNVRRLTLLVWLLAGIAAGLAILPLLSQGSGSSSGTATPLLLETVLATFIGAAFSRRRVVTIWGALLGAIAVNALSNGLGLLGVNIFWMGAIKGGLIPGGAGGLGGQTQRRRGMSQITLKTSASAEQTASSPLAWLSRAGFGVITLLAIALFGWANPVFLTVDNWANLLQGSAILLIVAMAMTLIVSAGAIDLSVGVALDFGAAFALVALKTWHLPWQAALGCALLGGVLIGLLNAFLILICRIRPFLATLGTWFIASSAERIYTDGGGAIAYRRMAPEYHDLAVGNLGGIPTPVAIVLALWLAGLAGYRAHPVGEYVRAIGQNSEAARIAGIRDRLTMLGVLVTASALCAVGGVILSANLRQFTPLAGQSYLMDAIAAVFIGTAFTRLGRVSILGTLGGVLFLAIIDNGLNLMGLNYLVKDALVGVILVVALALSFWQARLRQTHR